jgi:hypothetical protein
MCGRFRADSVHGKVLDCQLSQSGRQLSDLQEAVVKVASASVFTCPLSVKVSFLGAAGYA